MFIRKNLQLLLFLLIFITVSGCSISFEGSDEAKNKVNGGVFKSINNGQVWKQTTIIPNPAGNRSFSFANMLSMKIDPQDSQAIYVGTQDNGLLYSYNGAVSWNLATSLGKRSVQDIAISYDDKCVVYVVAENKIFKTNDCGREWTEIYYDNNLGVAVNTIAIHPTDPKIIYAGTSRGEVIRSVNYGKSWSVLKRFDNTLKIKNIKFDKKISVSKIVINEKSPNTIYVATVKNGVFQTTDGGGSWSSFKEKFMEINTANANYINDLVLAGLNQETVIVATKAGIIRSFDNGSHWRLIELITPAEETDILAVAVNPVNQDEIYYATATTFGFTNDGGENWSSKKLPTTRVASVIAVDFNQPEVVYLGVKTLVQKK